MLSCLKSQVDEYQSSKYHISLCRVYISKHMECSFLLVTHILYWSQVAYNILDSWEWETIA